MDELDPTIPLPPPSDSPRTGSPPSKSKGWQPPSTEELQALLPQYEITALLGRGGMGAVYKGTQKNLDRPVAIKILPPDMDDDENGANFTERFKNEARAMAKLSHPGIVAVFDFGETADGLLYIVMEFIEGTDVQKMVSEQGRLHSEHAMAITAHVCDALRYAHERGIIHRDIKPANIMVGYDGVVKVADFGLAKIDQGGTSGLTRSGMAMGTLHYMAPEALMLGSSVDQRADIYAVGVMLYYMLTGKLPQGMFELPSLQVPGLDPRYDGIIAKALRDDRSIRYQSTADLRRDLDAILTQPVVKVEPGTREAQPALPTDVRPQRPEGGQRTMHRPQERVEVRVERRGSLLLWTAVFVLGGFIAWTQWHQSPPASNPSISGPTGAASPATPSVAPVVAPTTSPSSASTSAPAATPVPPPSIPPQKKLQPGVWHNLLAEAPGDAFHFETGAAANLLPEPAARASGPPFRATSTVLALGKFSLKDCIVRARFSGEWKIAPYLVMHHRGKGRFVSGILGTGNTFLRKVYLNPNGTTTYTDFSKKPAFPLTSGTSFEVELKVVGDRYTLSSGGRIIVEGTDDFYEEGGMGFRMEKDTVIEMLEVMPLENAEAPPAAPVANSDGWRSLLDEKGKLLAAFNANQADSDGWRTLQKGFMPLLEAKNAALRLKARGTQGAIVLIVGWNAEGVSSMHGFRAHVGVDRDHSRLYKGWINGVTIVNGVYKPAAYIPQAQPPLEEIPARGEYELELRLHESTLD
ncbi:MAG TPA: serine/threonine-protein kinase, partial [Prosthecobacter sp.]|nr:serine/threonine-protein kinase [Prosthecobacter sp.]